MGESLPPPGLYVDAALVDLFKGTIDQLISDMGRAVVLYMPPVGSGCPNCLSGPDGRSKGIYNVANTFVINTTMHRPFPNGSICPVCHGSHQILTPVTLTYTALISRAPKNMKFSELGTTPENVYLTKMQIVAFEDVRRCDKAIIDGEYCVRLTDPVRTGLKVLNYVRCFWQKQT